MTTTPDHDYPASWFEADGVTFNAWGNLCLSVDQLQRRIGDQEKLAETIDGRLAQLERAYGVTPRPRVLPDTAVPEGGRRKHDPEWMAYRTGLWTGLGCGVVLMIAILSIAQAVGR